MSTKWTVQTAGYRERVRADNAKQAAISAFRRRLPSSAGLLTRVSGDKGVFFIETAVCLKAAGYKVEESEESGV